MTRLEANRKILEILKVQIETYPDCRFGQIMRNCDVITEDRTGINGEINWEDEFNLESEALLARIKKSPLVTG